MHNSWNSTKFIQKSTKYLHCSILTQTNTEKLFSFIGFCCSSINDNIFIHHFQLKPNVCKLAMNCLGQHLIFYGRFFRINLCNECGSIIFHWLSYLLDNIFHAVSSWIFEGRSVLHTLSRRQHVFEVITNNYKQFQELCKVFFFYIKYNLNLNKDTQLRNKFEKVNII